MVIRLSVIALLVSLSTVLSVGNPGVAFAAEATISVSPASVQVRPGDDVAIDYLVGDVGPLPGIGGYVLSVRFDPAVLELVTLLDGGFVTGGDNVVICGPTAIDNDAGIGVLFCAAVPLFRGSWRVDDATGRPCPFVVSGQGARDERDRS